MSKKEKKTDESAAEGAAPSEGKSKKKMIIIIAAVLVLALGGGGFYFFKMRAPKDTAEVAKVAPKKVFVDLRDMSINLAPNGPNERAGLIKLKATLEVSDAKVQAEIQPLLPRVEDAFQVFIRELRVSDLEGSAGSYRLKEELLRRVNIAVHPARVDAVLFKDMLVQ